MRVSYWARTDVGCVRDHNEDHFLVDEAMRLFVVCDGMGGHAAGEIASAMGVSLVREAVEAGGAARAALEQAPSSASALASVVELMRGAVSRASDAIYADAQASSARHGMGTTCTALLMIAGHAVVAHVGDSRLYRWRGSGQQVEQLTTDHSLVNEMIRLGKLEPGADPDIPNKNAVTRAVGVRQSVEVDAEAIAVGAGERLLLCSDGFHGYLEQADRLARFWRGPDLGAACERMIEFARDGGGKDNITVIAVDIIAPAGAPLPAEPSSAAWSLIAADPLFAHASAAEMVHLARLARRRALTEGGALQADGDLVWVESGSLSAGRGPEALGLRSFIQGTPETMTAREPSVVYVLGRDALFSAMRRAPALAARILWGACESLAIASVQADERATDAFDVFPRGGDRASAGSLLSAGPRAGRSEAPAEAIDPLGSGAFVRPGPSESTKKSVSLEALARADQAPGVAEASDELSALERARLALQKARSSDA